MELPNLCSRTEQVRKCTDGVQVLTARAGVKRGEGKVRKHTAALQRDGSIWKARLVIQKSDEEMDTDTRVGGTRAPLAPPALLTERL